MSGTRFGIVMVNMSIAPANAITAGNSRTVANSTNTPEPLKSPALRPDEDDYGSFA
jgi:hypothetical protein